MKPQLCVYLYGFDTSCKGFSICFSYEAILDFLLHYLMVIKRISICTETHCVFRYQVVCIISENTLSYLDYTEQQVCQFNMPTSLL